MSRSTIQAPSPGTDQDEFLKEAAESLRNNQARAEERSRKALRTIVSAAARQPHIRSERAWGLAPILLASFLSAAISAALCIFLLPRLQEQPQPNTAPQRASETKEEREARIMQEYEQSAATLGLRQ